MATTWKKVITSGSNAELGKLTTTVGLNISDLPGGDTESRVAVLGNAGYGPGENSILALTQSLLNATDTTYAADGIGIELVGTTFNIVDPGGIVHDDTYHPTMTNSHIKWQDVQGTPINQANITNSLYSEGTGVGITEINPTQTQFNTDATGQVWTSLGTADAPLQGGSIASGFGAISTTGSIGTADTLTADTLHAYASPGPSVVNQVGVTPTAYGIAPTTPGWDGGVVTAGLVSVDTMSVTSLLEIEGTFNIGTLEFTEDVVSHLTASQIFGGHATHSHQWTGSMLAYDGVTAQSLTGSGALLTNLSNNAFAYDNLTIGNGLSGSYAQTFDFGTSNVVSVEINNTGSGADLDLLSEYSSGGQNAYRFSGYHNPSDSGNDIATVGYPGSGLTTITLTANIGGEPAKRGAYHHFSDSANLANALVPYKHYRLSITCKTSLGSFQIRASNGTTDNYYAGYSSTSAGELTNTAYKTFTFDVSSPGASDQTPYIRVEKMSTEGQVVTVSDMTCHEIVGLAHQGEVEYSNGAGSTSNIYGIQIGNKSVQSQSFGALAVTNVKIKDQSVTFDKLNTGSIYEAGDIGAIDAGTVSSYTRKLLTSVGGNTPGKTPFNSIRVAIEGDLVPLVDWTNTGGSVTSVGVTTADITEADGLELSISADTTVAPTITLQEVIGDGVTGLKVNNTNWTGSVLSVVNGGTGASSTAQAAANIFSQTMATDGSVSSVTGEAWTSQKLSIGDGNDTIHISGSLKVQGSDTTINSADYKTKDRMIILAEGDTNSYTDVGIKFGRHVGSSNTLMFSNQAGVVGQKGRLGFGEFDFDTNGTGTAQADGTLTSYNAIGVFHTQSATSFAEASTSAALVEANQDGNILVDNAGDIYFHM